jgi:Tfp pilus assembly protein PilF
MFFFHAGVIEHALGNSDTARAYLRRALEINPKFNLKQAAEARVLLSSMEQ